jgi:glycosyltransferase involved in cell wall biosynthesis
MPTFNDAKYIKLAINSVLEQTHSDWQLIIINDGSTDNTKEVISEYLNLMNIKYLEQENKGQLKAVETGSKFIDGDYVCILHSDDLLSQTALNDAVSRIEKDGCDGVFGDLVIIDQKGRETSVVRLVDTINRYSPIDVLMRNGSNIVPDVFFVTRKVFDQQVRPVYIEDNSIYWVKDANNGFGILRLSKIAPYYKYRIYRENYIKSEVGRFVVFNGSLRTCLKISKKVNIPCFFLQKNFWRLALRVPGFKTMYSTIFRPIFWYSKKNNANRIFLKKIIASVYKNYQPDNDYFKAILAVGNQRHLPSTEMRIDVPENLDVFSGAEMGNFYKKLIDGDLPFFYKELFIKIQENNISSFCVRNEAQRDKLQKILDSLGFPIGIKSGVKAL